MIRDDVSAQEWQTRVDLAACYRLVDHYGMSDLIYNHITARIPGTEHLLINLYGLLYKEITASSLVKIDLEGNIVWKPNTDYGINVSGYVIHGAIHKARADVVCVLHTHTRAGMAVAAMQCGLLPLSQTAMRFVGHIGLHDYEGPAIDLGERERIVRDLGPHDALIMRTASVQHHVPAGVVVSLAGRRDGSAHRTDDAGPKRTRPNGASIPAGHAAALWCARMADAAPLARGAAAGFRLPAILELSFGPGGIRWTAVHKSTTAPWKGSEARTLRLR